MADQFSFLRGWRFSLVEGALKSKILRPTRLALVVIATTSAAKAQAPPAPSPTPNLPAVPAAPQAPNAPQLPQEAATAPVPDLGAPAQAIIQPPSTPPYRTAPEFPTPNFSAPDGATNIAPGDTTSAPTLPTLPNPAPEANPQSPVVTETEPANGEFILNSPQGVIYDMERGLALARGGVTLKYGSLLVTGERGVVDFNSRLATLTGKLTVKTRDRELTGRSLSFNIDTKVWTLSQLAITLPPELFPNNSVIEPIYITGGAVTGAGGRVTGQDFRVSSCDRGHYYFQSKEVRFYQNRTEEPTRIVLRRNALFVLGRRLLPLPVFTVNLTSGISRRVPLQPIVGQNSTDGVFVKTTYSLAATAKRTDSLLIDLLQKRGIGLGFNRELAEGAGLIYLYALTGGSSGREMDARFNRTWKITPALNAIVNFQSTQNSSPGFSNKSQNGDLSFIYQRPNVNTNLQFRTGSSGSGDSSYSDLGATLQHRQTFGSLDLDLGTLYNRNSFGGGNESETLDNTVLLTWRQKRLDTFLRAENHDDLTGVIQKNGAYQLERLPEFGFTTDTTRTPLPFFSKYAPGDITMSLGEFNEPSSGQRLMRTLLSYGFRPRTLQLLKRGKFNSQANLAGRFEQAFYSNNTARYNYDGFLNLTNDFGPLSLRVDYVKTQFHGFTPFQFDFLFPGETLDATLAYHLADRLQLDITGGQDIQNKIPRDYTAQLRVQPNPNLYFSLGASLSRQTHQLGDLVGNFHLDRPKRRFFAGTFDLGVRYSPATHQLSALNAATDVLVTKKTRVQALTSYNGFSKKFDFTQFRIVRDLHCFNLYATYDQQRKEIRLDLALKAFPFVDSRYGRNDTGTGFNPFFGQLQ